MLYEPITILSAELPHLDFHANTDRTNELRLALVNDGYSFVGITKVTNEKTTQAFLVPTAKHSSLLKLAEQFGQSSILISDSSRNTIELSTKGEKALEMGKLFLSSKDNAVKQKSYLRVTEENKTYYFTTKGEADVN